jgi:hypothetical protein
LTRARREPGDNIIQVRINNEPMDPPFDGHDTEHQRKLQSLTNGFIHFAYSTTLMRHEQSWKLDLSTPTDNAIAHKLLEKIFDNAMKQLNNERIAAMKKKGSGKKETEEEITGTHLIAAANQDTWTNCKHNSKPFELKNWFIDLGKITSSILEQEAQQQHHTSQTNTWRVPTSGLLEFDAISSHPQVVVLTSHTFNLSNTNDVVTLRDLWTRACGHKGKVSVCFLFLRVYLVLI